MLAAVQKQLMMLPTDMVSLCSAIWDALFFVVIVRGADRAAHAS